MNRFAVTTLIIASLNASSTSATAQAVTDANDPREGKRLALKICTACHVVSPDQPEAPILRPPAPSFRAIARRLNANEESLRAFLSTTHTTIKAPFNMPNPQLTDGQVASLVAYLMSLKGAQ